MDANDYICRRCIGDSELRTRVRHARRRQKCAVCHKRASCVTFGELAGWIHEAYSAWYQPSAYDWYREGQEPAEIIMEMAEVEHDVATSVIEILRERQYRDVRHGAEDLYDSDQLYVSGDVYPGAEHYAWDWFCHEITHKERYFGKLPRGLLDELFEDFETLYKGLRWSPVVQACPGDEAYFMFRARRAKSIHEARKILKNPARELNRCPAERAKAGRLNAAGISVFYGAFSPKVCIAEVKPSVGGLAVTAKFKMLRPMRLLDLTAFRYRPIIGSMFDPNFGEKLARAKFLRHFSRIISRPVQPHEEDWDYVPTQAVAEYFANVLGFNGLIYDSSQIGGDFDSEEDDDTFLDEDQPDYETKNVALFGDAGIVDEPAEEEKQNDSVPPVGLEDSELDTLDSNALELDALMNFEYTDTDDHKPGLQYIADSVEVHRVESIQVSTCREHLPKEGTAESTVDSSL